MTSPDPARPVTDSAASVVCIASWNVDMVLHLPRPIAKGETLVATRFETSPGGKGSNAAVAAARLGAAVSLVARVGDDDLGRMGLALWQREGMDTRYVVHAAGQRSGMAQIQVFEDGDNSIAVYPGANAGLTADHARAARPALANCKVVMASNEVPQACTAEAFAIARQAGAITVFNPAPALPMSAALLAQVDVLTPNRDELLCLAGAARTATVAAFAAAPAAASAEAPGDEQAAAQALLALGLRAVVVTRGASGCCLYQAGQASVALPAWPVQVQDSIGAGDCFTGALAAALARGQSLLQALHQANAAAALSVQGVGALGGLPDAAAVAALLATRPAG